MTDRISPPEHIDPDGEHSLTLLAHSKSAFFTVAIHDLNTQRSHPVRLPAEKLLAMIDTEAPDAMRAYLRERSDLMDSPDESCSTLEGMLPADLAAEAARFREVPEADSPEDTDAPDPVEQMRESGRQLGEAWRALSDAFREASKGSNR